MVEQYNKFCPLDDGETCVNGRLTLGENIGDLGGLSLAYRAYKLSLNGAEDRVIDGLSGDQRFFLAWAQVWRSQQREDNARQRLRTDSHSPEEYRVNGVVRNMPRDISEANAVGIGIEKDGEDSPDQEEPNAHSEPPALGRGVESFAVKDGHPDENPKRYELELREIRKARGLEEHDLWKQEQAPEKENGSRSDGWPAPHREIRDWDPDEEREDA